jgi:hypothetical protein
MMNRMLIVTAVGLLASALGSGVALAQQATDTGGGGAAMEDIIVSASRSKVNSSATRWPKTPVQTITLSYAVNAASYDLTTSAGVAGLEKVVNATAADVCKEVFSAYPAVKPDDGECAKTAAANAMVRVHELVAAATGKAGK